MPASERRIPGEDVKKLLELLLAMGEIVDEIKTVHCRKEYVQVETWDYFDEVS